MFIVGTILIALALAWLVDIVYRMTVPLPEHTMWRAGRWMLIGLIAVVAGILIAVRVA